MALHVRSDVTLRIKNLSFSLEALSRINREGASSLYSDIEALLEKEIQQAEKEQGPYKPTARATTTDDDDIPF